ncbi:hypothetical protein G6F68_016157 [Rhizopus microsporus]|nr:hypothetical protein G6F68_016157 [Rhizopus microsporus]
MRWFQATLRPPRTALARSISSMRAAAGERLRPASRVMPNSRPRRGRDSGTNASPGESGGTPSRASTVTPTPRSSMASSDIMFDTNTCRSSMNAACG